MARYKIEFSKETQIGGAYDEFNHEIAQIQVELDQDTEVEFRSDDFRQEVKKSENEYSLKLDNGSEIKISGENTNLSVTVDGNQIDTNNSEFSYQNENGTFKYSFDDKDTLYLETESEEIVNAISLGLALIAYKNNH